MSAASLLRLLLLGAVCAATARAAMRDALTTVHLLAGFVETHLVRLDLPDARGATPRKTYSVVLTFDGALWLYTPGLGTRPLGPAPRDEARASGEIAARLRRLAPALGRIEVIAHPLQPAVSPTDHDLRNGCFAGCLFFLIERFARGERVDEAGVIFLSSDTAAAPGVANLLRDVGHSLLVYRAADQWFVVDPANPDVSQPLQVVPRVGREVDPALVAYARGSRYEFDHAEYLRFSAPALQRLAADVAWRILRPDPAPKRDR